MTNYATRSHGELACSNLRLHNRFIFSISSPPGTPNAESCFDNQESLSLILILAVMVVVIFTVQKQILLSVIHLSTGAYGHLARRQKQRFYWLFCNEPFVLNLFCSKKGHRFAQRTVRREKSCVDIRARDFNIL